MKFFNNYFYNLINTSPRSNERGNDYQNFNIQLARFCVLEFSDYYIVYHGMPKPSVDLDWHSKLEFAL